MDVEGNGFVIKDKRVFDEKGDLKDEKSEEQAAPQDVEKEEPKPKEFRGGPLPEVNFSSLIFSLSSSALMHLGEVADPQTGEKKKDLAIAKHTIDTIAMAVIGTLYCP